MNNRGKTLTIFIVLTIILLISSTSIGFFLYNKEILARKDLQAQLDVSKYNEMKLQGDLKEAKREMALAKDKVKETDDKINNLMDEIELNDGLRKELKTENTSLKESIETAKKEKEKILQSFEEAKKQYGQINELFKNEQDKVNALQLNMAKLQTENDEAKKTIAQIRTGFTNENGIPANSLPPKIELDNK